MEEKNVNNDIRKKGKKKNKFLKGLLIFLIIIAIIVIALNYMFPGLFFAQKLGVNYTDNDYTSAIDKLENAKSLNAEIEFTSEEITAVINENIPSNSGIKNVQFKVANNNSIEAVGTVNIDYFLENVLNNKYSKEKLQEQIPLAGILPENVNLYLNLEGIVNDNKTEINVKEVRIQGIPLPSSIIDSVDINDALSSQIDKLISSSGSTIGEISIENGKVYLKGIL